ncbi:MAG: 4-hydroxy-tetrahydrodipicolinate reductase [Syntrophomonadaceae bacterium]
MVNVGLIGLGRIGKVIAKSILEHPGLNLVLVVHRTGSKDKYVGQDLGDVLNIRKTGIEIKGSHNLSNELAKAKPDVIVDFTNPEACLKNLKTAAIHKTNFIVGTTGFTREELATIEHLAYRNRISIVYAPNLTTGINVLLNLVKKLANLLPDWDTEIIEIHHKHKKDAPSGTAVKLAEEIGRERGIPVETSVLYSRKGIQPRKTGEITVHAIRGGGVVGVHEVMFISENEKISIKHESLNRNAFADCLMKVIDFINNNKPGYYTVEEALNLVEFTEHEETGIVDF